MDNRRPILITTETTQRLPILIIDKKGDIGASIAEKLQDQFLIVLASNNPPPAINTAIIHIHFGKKIPSIPDNTYSHIFTIYNGEKEILDILPALVRKSQQTNAKLLFITSLLNSSPQLFKHLNAFAHHFEVSIYGETFSNQAEEANTLNLLIRQARRHATVTVSNLGLRPTYPIHYMDVITGIIAVGFALDRKRRLVYLFPPHPYTEIALARLLQKNNPSLKIDFKKDNDKDPEMYIPPGGEYIFHNYDLDSKLQHIDVTRQENLDTVPKRQTSALKKKKKETTRLSYILTLSAILVLPLLATVASTSIGILLLNTSLQTSQTGNFTQAKQYAQIAKLALDTTQVFASSLFYLDSIAKQPKQEFLEKVQTGEEIAQTEIETLTAAETMKNILKGGSQNPQNDFLHVLATFKNSLITLQKLKAEKQLPGSVNAKLSQLNTTIMFIENTMDTFPILLGFDAPKQYLVLFQNNMELRPGGGFIGSYGLLKIHNGKVDDFKVYDVYDADGKLKEHVEPPFALRRYLGASHWFLRDSNFDVDFPKNAALAANFLKLETGESVDGVIAMDTDFLKKMLEVLGSVKVADYNETVTPDNFYLLTQDHAEKNFFPGSTQKKDFLKSLANTIMNELTDPSNHPTPAQSVRLLQKVGEAIQEKHLIFSFPQPNVQQLFTVNNLSAAIWDGSKRGDNGFLDFLSLSEANLGTNKGNFYLKRSVEQKATITEQGSLQETVSITYQNTSTKQSPYGGDYKNYLRFILPQGAELQEVQINDLPVATTAAITDSNLYTRKNFLPPTELEVERNEDFGKNIYGFLVVVPMSQTKKVSISYAIPQTIEPERSVLNYDLKVLKQPGVQSDPYTFSLVYPNTFQLLTSSVSLADVGGKLLYTGNLQTDQSIQISLTKK
jgi:hypothetical protein